jgi:histidine ammonia-lyase
MIAQYTAAALVAENRVLAHPASVDSIPTSGSQEDHVSMGWGAGKKLAEIIVNVQAIVGIEMLVASQGLESRLPLRPGRGVAQLLALIRASIPPLEQDRSIAGEISLAADLIRSGSVDAVLAEIRNH